MGNKIMVFVLGTNILKSSFTLNLFILVTEIGF